MKCTILHILIFIFIPFPISEGMISNFIVWNVGQGSWATFIHKTSCFHFDMGGETLPIKKVLGLCKNKTNEVFISHEDWDHINGIKPFSKKAKQLCLRYPHPFKKKFLKQFQRCKESHLSLVKRIYTGPKNKDRNSSSIVYSLDNQILFPGDSPVKQEKIWYRFLKPRYVGIILGHHGSHTSTSSKLLQRIQPKWAVASARKSKYGHPHRKVLKRLKKQKVPVYSTETFGNLYFHLKIRSFERKAYIPFQDHSQQAHKSQFHRKR